MGYDGDGVVWLMGSWDAVDDGGVFELARTKRK